jgi:DNA-directed RNA polymerase specialized sigma24 family protein
LTERKATRLRRHEGQQKRGGGTVLDETALASPGDTQTPCGGFDQFAGREPTPEFAAEVAEECARLFDLLGDIELRSIALWKMEGHTTDEIAARLGRAPRSVERKLHRIRNLWEGQEP